MELIVAMLRQAQAALEIALASNPQVSVILLGVLGAAAVVLVAAAWNSVPALVAADPTGAATRLRQTADPGRLLAQSDDEVPGRHPVALVSYELWQGRFAGRSDIVGHDMRLNGHVFTIVGVTPEGFPGPQLGNRFDIYVPMMMQAIVRPPRAAYSGEQNPDLLKNPGNGWLRTIGKMHPGVAPEQVRAELGTLAANWARTMTPTAPVVQMPEKRAKG